MSLPSKVSKCGSPPPPEDSIWQYSPSHPPKHSHTALQFGAMTGFPLPEQSKNDKRYLSCRFDIRTTEMRRRRRRSTYTNRQHRPCIAFPDKRNYLWEDHTNQSYPVKENQNSIKAQLQAVEYVDIYHATYYVLYFFLIFLLKMFCCFLITFCF